MMILLDTNFLIDITRFRIDIEGLGQLLAGPYTLVTLSSVLDELEKVSRGKTKSSLFAKVALRLVKEHKVEVLDSRIQTDKALLNLSGEALVATNDRRLRKELKAVGRKTIYLKSRKYLAIG